MNPHFLDSLKQTMILSSPSLIVLRISAQSLRLLRPRYQTRTFSVSYFACSQTEWTISGLLLLVVRGINYSPGDSGCLTANVNLYKLYLLEWLVFSSWLEWWNTLFMSKTRRLTTKRRKRARSTSVAWNRVIMDFVSYAQYPSSRNSLMTPCNDVPWQG